MSRQMSGRNVAYVGSVSIYKPSRFCLSRLHLRGPYQETRFFGVACLNVKPRRCCNISVIRAGLYPEPDPAERVPNPIPNDVNEGQKDQEQRNGNSVRSEAQTSDAVANVNAEDGDVLEPSILERARKLFNISSSSNEIASDPERDNPGQKSSGNAYTSSPREQELRRRGPEAPTSPLKGQVEFWPADEIDVAAAESIKRDHEAVGTVSNMARLNVQSPNQDTLPSIETNSIDVQRASRALWKAGWWAWWIQLVLSTISGVIVLFAIAFPGVNIRTTASSIGVLLCGSSVAIALTSLLWTYGYTRLAIRVRQSQPKFLANAPARVRGYIRVGLIISVFGLFVGLVGLQAIVGTLLARLLGTGIATTPYSALQSNGLSRTGAGFVNGASMVQPVDVLVIQACANAMSSLLAGLITAIWLRGRLRVWTRQEA